jgi:hypothetical protein
MGPLPIYVRANVRRRLPAGWAEAVDAQVLEVGHFDERPQWADLCGSRAMLEGAYPAQSRLPCRLKLTAGSLAVRAAEASNGAHYDKSTIGLDSRYPAALIWLGQSGVQPTYSRNLCTGDNAASRELGRCKGVRSCRDRRTVTVSAVREFDQDNVTATRASPRRLVSIMLIFAINYNCNDDCCIIILAKRHF